MNGESVINFPSVDVSVGESTAKWLHGLMSHTLSPHRWVINGHPKKQNTLTLYLPHLLFLSCVILSLGEEA